MQALTPKAKEKSRKNADSRQKDSKPMVTNNKIFYARL
jgi:hypothetical protein